MSLEAPGYAPLCEAAGGRDGRRGKAAIGGLDINQAAEHLLKEWATIRPQLWSGVYRSRRVYRVIIPNRAAASLSQALPAGRRPRRWRGIQRKDPTNTIPTSSQSTILSRAFSVHN